MKSVSLTFERSAAGRDSLATATKRARSFASVFAFEEIAHRVFDRVDAFADERARVERFGRS